MAMTFKERLASLQKNWDGAREEAKNNFKSNVPDGKYIAQIVGAELAESQSSGRLQVGWQYCILEGEHTGELLRDYDGCETEENLVWLARKLDRLGYDTLAFELPELEDVLKDVVASAITVQVRVKTNGEFQNIYIDKRVEDYKPQATVVAPQKPTTPPKQKTPPAAPVATEEKPETKPEPVASSGSSVAPGSRVSWKDEETSEDRTGVVRAISPNGEFSQVTREDNKRLVKVKTAILTVLPAK